MREFKVIDMHCDTITAIARANTSFVDNDLHISLRKLQKGNYMMQCFAIFIYLKGLSNPFEKCNEYMDLFDQFMKENEKEIAQVTTAKEIVENDANGKISALLTIEEGGVLEGKLENLQHFYDRGVRMMTLTWNFENEIAFPNYVYEDVPRCDTERGLKPFGFEVINKMWDLGMIVDVSHLNDAGIYDVLNNARKPIVASHSNSRAVWNVPRNMSDDMIRKLKANGGIMGMNYCNHFVSGNTDRNQIPDIVEHVKHIADIAGVETIGLGGDFDGISTPIGMSDCTKTHDLYAALKEAGFSQNDIDMMFYKNFLRVLEANEVK